MNATTQPVGPLETPEQVLYRKTPALWRRILSQRSAQIGLVLVGLLLLIAVGADVLTSYDPLRANNPQFLPPLTGDHYLGTTAIGRDLFSAIAYGARVSLAVGILVAVLSTLIGLVIGSAAGYLGGWIDDVLMRVTDLFIVIPRFFLALLVVAIFGQTFFNIVLVLALLSWPPVARVVRAQYLTLKEREFVLAARVIGMPTPRIVVREILPNALAPVIVLGSLQVSQAILLEAGLAFLGLGDPDLPSWGGLLVDAHRFLSTAPWMVIFPGLAITVAVIGFNLLGDGLARAIDPRTGARFGA